MDTSLHTRRDFMIRGVQAGSLVAFGGVLSTLLSACNSGGSGLGNAPTLPTINATPVNNTITISTASGSPISGVGSAALVQYNGGYLLVAHTAQDAFTVLTAICTHQGCIVDGYSGGIYTCPCHGAEYDTNGNVVHGPATAALRKIPAQYSDNQLVISV
jgi:Rieske Fe-S protein